MSPMFEMNTLNSNVTISLNSPNSINEEYDHFSILESRLSTKKHSSKKLSGGEDLRKSIMGSQDKSFRQASVIACYNEVFN